MATTTKVRPRKPAPLYLAQPPVQQWTCTDTVTEIKGTKPRAIPTRKVPAGVELTWSDFLAGAGGSSSGIEMVPGNGVVMAVNHWPLAVESHQANMPDTDHDVANVARVAPTRYPKSDCAWFSPECTYWSMARGEPCDYDQQSQQLSLLEGLDEEEEPAAKEARWRSRMLMTDVVRFARHHKYKALVVENVPDILKWSNFDRWIGEMHAEGYKHKVLSVNSAFAFALGAPAPQLRDRVYVVFWKARYKTPNWRKWLSPKAWCPSCGDVVEAVYTPKPGPRRPMRYGAQYYYRCPQPTCRGAAVHPYIVPAQAAINWDLPTQRIGDRKTPLADATYSRIEAGLAKYARHFLAETAGHTFERRPGVRTRPLDRPLGVQSTTATTSLVECPTLLVPTGGSRRGKGKDGATSAERPMATRRTTTETDAVVCPPFLTVLRSGRPRNLAPDHDPLATVVGSGSGHALIVPVNARDGQRARHSGEPLRTQTGRHEDALVVPLRNNGVSQLAADWPLMTVAAGGTHHALVMRNNRGGAEMCTPADEPVRTLTTKGHQSLIGVDSHALYGYDSGDLRPLDMPMPTQTTVEGDALVGHSIAVEDCTLRMLGVDEIQFGMAFARGYILLGNAKRDKIRMLGNAVTPNVARDLAACLTEAITGRSIDLVQLGLAA